MKLETKCIHSGTVPDEQTGGINTPIYTSSAFRYIDDGKQSYPRYFNTPNQEAVIGKLCALEGAEDGIVFSSGMAAISTALFGFLQSGDHLVIQSELYGGTHALVTQQFPRFSIDYSFVDKSIEALEAAIGDKTRVIYIETPTNPLLGIVDIEKVVALARSYNIITIIDNTFASPINQNPLQFGIDVVIHSGTKYLGGHSDICCGAVLASEKLIEEVRVSGIDFGGSLNGTTCALLERSLKTLHLRVSRQSENGLIIARELEQNPKVDRVYYPGLQNHPGHEIAASQMQGFGGMLSFSLTATAPSVTEFMRNLSLIVPALSLGGIETTICAPALTSHRKMDRESRERIGVTDKLLRLSVGIEHPEDILKDIASALRT
ncbi:MAG: PLP-dependent transferase [Desulfobulbaceae bacterium]|nr:MAG: PLP-dependent transferase [Desulfobulbaceae bacterium]